MVLVIQLILTRNEALLLSTLDILLSLRRVRNGGWIRRLGSKVSMAVIVTLGLRIQWMVLVTQLILAVNESLLLPALDILLSLGCVL